MKCQEARLWLLSSKSREPLPTALERHLEDCARCRAKRRVLGRLDERVRAVPIPDGSKVAKEQFFKRLAETPGPSPQIRPEVARPVKKTSQRSNLAIRCGAGLVAACALIAVGWIMGRRDVPISIVEVPVPAPVAQKAPETPLPKVTPKSPAIGTVEKSNQLALLVRILKHNGRLAETFDAAEQVHVLSSLAEDLKTELLESVRRDALDESVVLAELYAAVVRVGMLSRIDRLPPDARQALAAIYTTRFQAAADEMIAKGQNARPMAKELLAATASTASEAANAFTGLTRTDVASAEQTRQSSRSILQTIVYKGLAVASEPNPLERANLCSDATARIAPSVILLSATAAPAEADALGSGLGEWFDRGVAANLDGIDRGNPAARDEAEKVRARAAKTFEAMEADLVKAPAAARDNVKRVIDASAPGWERAAFGAKGKGKGAPWRKNDDKALPPGLQKKSSIDAPFRHRPPLLDVALEQPSAGRVEGAVVGNEIADAVGIDDEDAGAGDAAEVFVALHLELRAAMVRLDDPGRGVGDAFDGVDGGDDGQEMTPREFRFEEGALVGREDFEIGDPRDFLAMRSENGDAAVGVGNGKRTHRFDADVFRSC